jgi:hypothetical protein
MTKTKILALVSALLIAAITTATNATAATPAWSYPLPDSAAVYNLAADGAGGAAFTYNTFDAVRGFYVSTVVWLDNQGRQLYKKTDTSGSTLLIIGVTKKGLVYDFQTGTVFVVDRDGRETSIERATRANNFQFEGVNIDEAGLFLLQYVNQTPDSSSAIIARYTFKP